MDGRGGGYHAAESVKSRSAEHNILESFGVLMNCFPNIM